jgi:energy-converting hydrogenase Eha subunit H
MSANTQNDNVLFFAAKLFTQRIKVADWVQMLHLTRLLIVTRMVRWSLAASGIIYFMGFYDEL